jgi:hypothetical protein
MARKPDPAGHWDAAYAQGADTRSWFQLRPAMSLQMLDTAGVSARDGVLDVGGGASPLAGILLGRGFADLTVLDISATVLQYARRRLGPQAERVRWLRADVLTWRPQRRYQVWHDRAVFHFLTGGLVHLQGLCLPTATIKGKHELGMETFSQRMLRGQGLKLMYQLAVAAQVQPGVDPPFQGLQPHLFQPRHLLVVQQPAWDVRQRLAPPQAQRLA